MTFFIHISSSTNHILITQTSSVNVHLKQTVFQPDQICIKVLPVTIACAPACKYWDHSIFRKVVTIACAPARYLRIILGLFDKVTIACAPACKGLQKIGIVSRKGIKKIGVCLRGVLEKSGFVRVRVSGKSVFTPKSVRCVNLKTLVKVR